MNTFPISHHIQRRFYPRQVTCCGAVPEGQAETEPILRLLEALVIGLFGTYYSSFENLDRRG